MTYWIQVWSSRDYLGDSRSIVVSYRGMYFPPFIQLKVKRRL